MKPTHRAALVCALSLLALNSAHANDTFTVGGVFGLAYTSGGDTVDSLRYTNGTTQNINAGGQYNFKLGAEARLKNYPLQIQATANYHYNSDSASNSEDDFTRITIELVGYYNLNNKWRLGLGLRYVTATRYSTKFENDPKFTFKFEPSFGYLVEGEYFFTKLMSVSARIVQQDVPWKYQGLSGKLSGNHIGMGFNIYW